MQVWNVEFSEELYQQARDYFLWLGRSDFLLKSKLSLCGRYGISQKMKELWFPDFVPEDGVYTCWVYTYAISHSHEQLFFAVDEKKVTVDVEKVVPRDESLLVGISDFWLGLEIWEAFYLHWTAKECVVKYLDLSLEEILDSRIKILGQRKKEKDPRKKTLDSRTKITSRHCASSFRHCAASRISCGKDDEPSLGVRGNPACCWVDCHAFGLQWRDVCCEGCRGEYVVEVEYRWKKYTIFAWLKNWYCFSWLL